MALILLESFDNFFFFNLVVQGSAGLILLLGQGIGGLVLVGVAGAVGAPVVRDASANGSGLSTRVKTLGGTIVQG